MTVQGVDPFLLALFLGALSLLPMLMVVCTAFLKICIVLMITRNAIGVQQVPPSMALYGIALAATLFVMAPVFDQAYREAWLPYSDSQMNFMQAADLLPVQHTA